MKTKTYYIVEDDFMGQHGTDIKEVELTRDQYLKIRETRDYNGHNVFITNSYYAALCYTQD